MNRYALLACLVICLCGCLSDPDRVARGSVVENEIAGLLRDGEGPALGARVRLFSADSGAGGRSSGTEGAAIRETTTDGEGRFRFTGVQAGAYSILGQENTLLAFRDSVLVSPGPNGGGAKIELPPDTLLPPGGIEVQVSLKSGDDPTSITGEVLGTPFSAHGGATGDLSMSGMPAGRLRIRFTSSLPGYLPLTVSVDVASGRTTMAGTLILPSRSQP